MDGIICRCGVYQNVVRAVQSSHRTRFHRDDDYYGDSNPGIRDSSVAKTPSSCAANRSSPPTSTSRTRPTSQSSTAPIAHARIKSIDASAALKMPGVVRVFTGADLAGKMMPMVCIWKPAGVESHFGPHPYGLPGSQTALATDKVRYVGEWVAAVVAETREQAYAALPAVKVDYEALPSVSRAEDALKPGAPQLHDTVPGNLCAHVDLRRQGGHAEGHRRRRSQGAPRHHHPAPVAPAARNTRHDGPVRRRHGRVRPLHQHPDPARQQLHDLQPGHGHPVQQAARHRAGYRRRLRLEGLPLPGRTADAVPHQGGGPAGEVGGYARRAVGHDGPQPRPAAARDAGGQEGRHDHRAVGHQQRRPRRLLGQQRPRRAARADRPQRHRCLCHSAPVLRSEPGLCEHGVARSGARRRPHGGHPPHRAPDRHLRAPRSGCPPRTFARRTW